MIDEFTVAGPGIALDTTPPVVALTAPVNGATVSGTVALTATATDNVAVTGVQFQLDGKNLARDYRPPDPRTCFPGITNGGSQWTAHADGDRRRCSR